MGCGMMGHGGMMGPGTTGIMGGGTIGGGIMGGGAMAPPFMMRMIFSLMDSDGDGTISLPGVSGGSRTDFQGDGWQQRWPAYPGGDASVHAGDQEIGFAAIDDHRRTPTAGARGGGRECARREGRT